MKFLIAALVSLGATIASANAEPEPKLAQLVPREQWLKSKRDNILQGGGWALVSSSTCPAGSQDCGSGCCPNSLYCQSGGTALVFGADDAACCPDANICSTSLATTPFCADASWELWENASGSPPYFCCLEGQLGLQTGECVSGKQVAAPSLVATSLGIVTAGAVFQTGSETKSINTATTTAEETSSITSAPTATTKTINGGSLESSILSKASSALHNKAGQMGVATHAAQAVVGTVIAAGVFL